MDRHSVPEPGVRVRSSGPMARDDRNGSSEDLLDLLGDECARSILSAAAVQAVTAKELIARSEVSETTIYRRINTLVDHGLLEERVVFLGGSKQTTVYRATFSHIEILLGETGFEVEKHTDDAARVAYLLSELPFETLSIDITEQRVTAQAEFDEQLIDRLGALLTTD